MEIGQQGIDAADCYEFTAACCEHCIYRVFIGTQRIEGKCPLGYGAHQHHAESIGKGESGGSVDGGCFIFDAGVNSRADDCICSIGNS